MLDLESCFLNLSSFLVRAGPMYYFTNYSYSDIQLLINSICNLGKSSHMYLIFI